jgi:hypothetical protein
MIGLMFVAAAAVYLALLIGATLVAYRLARKRGWSVGKASIAGSIAFLAVYLPVFWDHLPTVIAHHYYCSTEANFVVRKTTEQWAKENSELVSSLRYEPKAAGVRMGEYMRFPLNQRIVSERRNPTPVFLSVAKREGRIVDVQTGEFLASFVDFRTGSPSPGGKGWWKVWLQRRSCDLSDSGFGVPFAAQELEWTKLGGVRK